MSKDIRESIKAHSIRGAVERHKPSGQYLKSAVYGGLDGIITTFAVVAGVAGASLSAGIVLILGFANLIADGLSMAIGDFLSTKAENEFHKAERKREQWEVENYPRGEIRESVELLTDKGYSKKDATKMVKILSKNKEGWIDFMMVEELGILESNENPWKNALTTFSSFGIFGFVPLLAYIIVAVYSIRFDAFIVASVLTGATLFVLGALKVKITSKNWFNSGLEMLVVGGITAVVAYGIGYLLAGLA